MKSEEIKQNKKDDSKVVKEYLSTERIRIHSKNGSKWAREVKFTDGTKGLVIDDEFHKQHAKTRDDLLKYLTLGIKDENNYEEY